MWNPRRAASRAAPPITIRKPTSFGYGIGRTYAPYEDKELNKSKMLHSCHKNICYELWLINSGTEKIWTSSQTKILASNYLQGDASPVSLTEGRLYSHNKDGSDSCSSWEATKINLSNLTSVLT